MTASPTVGTQAAHVRVTVTVSCTTVVYKASSVGTRAEAVFTQDARELLGSGYTLVGGSTTAIMRIKRSTHGLTIMVHVQGIWVYQFSEAQIRHLVSLIAGKPSRTAQALLARIEGITRVSVQLSHVGDQVLPADPTHIQIQTITIID